ncbi:cell division protein ZapE [Glaciibacter sp. 2TAF33]|uniref:cell division protein ZapE n=1 Tax=Glaciibacter sp. 2TAF33 TaxID=3233015 RepID=UPI003F8FA897
MTAVLDADQRLLADRLQRLVLRGSTMDAAGRPGPPSRGVYVHGSVGRGKTWLCDEFFHGLPTTAKRRVHFHGFFRQLHQAIWRRRTAAEPGHGDAVGDAIADLLDGVDLLYFDEFHVHDSGDAVLISRVLEVVFSRGITLLVTSNYPPAGLLPHPGFHDLIEPSIALLEAHLDIVELGGTVDFRRAGARATVAAGGHGGDGDGRGGPVGRGFAAGTWAVSAEGLTPEGRALPHPSEETTLDADGHRFTARRVNGDEVWFRFDDLCEADASVADYLEWASVFNTWVLDDVPVLGAATPQARQRFANLVDVLCDRDATLHIVSVHPPETALRAEALPRDFARAASRLALLRPVR